MTLKRHRLGLRSQPVAQVQPVHDCLEHAVRRLLAPVLSVQPLHRDLCAGRLDSANQRGGIDSSVKEPVQRPGKLPGLSGRETVAQRHPCSGIAAQYAERATPRGRFRAERRCPVIADETHMHQRASRQPISRIVSGVGPIVEREFEECICQRRGGRISWTHRVPQRYPVPTGAPCRAGRVVRPR